MASAQQVLDVTIHGSFPESSGRERRVCVTTLKERGTITNVTKESRRMVRLMKERLYIWFGKCCVWGASRTPVEPCLSHTFHLPYSALGSGGSHLRDKIHSLLCPLASVWVWPVGNPAGNRKERGEWGVVISFSGLLLMRPSQAGCTPSISW